MTNHNQSRREFVAASGTFAAAWLGTDPDAFLAALRAARAAASGESVRYDVLTAQQAQDLDAMASQIIPTDDLPGAREARVVVFIDRALGSFQSSQRESTVEGIDDLNRRVAEHWPGAGRFASQSEGRQLLLLKEIEDTSFFRQVRNWVVTGMFAHPQWGGNFDGAGWKVLGFESRYVWQPPFGEYDAEEMGR